MKTILHLAFAHHLRNTLGLVAGLTAILTGLLLPPAANAEVDLTINLFRTEGNFRGSLYLYDNDSADTYHRVESPNGLIYANSGYGDSASPILSFSALMNECTNGLWTLIENVGDPLEEQYAFSVNITGLTSNMFGDTTITNPLNSAVLITNQPLIEWSSTSLLPQVHIQVHNGSSPPQPGNWANMVAPVNSFQASPVLGGQNYIYLSYQDNDFSGITITIPTNLVGGATVSDWSASGDVSSYDFSTFEAPGGAEDPFDVAVESPGLSWSTYGDPEGWFVSSQETSVGPTALQSGFVFDDGSSTLETTVQGPGTVSFDWAMFADYGDGFEFNSYDNNSGEDYDYFYYEGYDAYGWDSHSLTLHSNDTYTLSWTFYNEDDSGFDMDAAFLDNVIAPGGAGNSPLGEAVDAPELVWTTGGDADWFDQTDETDDGEDAAASDLYGYSSAESWIETTVVGPGSMDFSWALFGDVNDTLTVTVDGYSEDYIEGDWGWDYSGVYIGDTGPVTVRWTFYHEDVLDGPGEAYLDQVSYSPEPPDYEAEMDLEIELKVRNGTTNVIAFPRLNYLYPDAYSSHEVESPTGKFKGSESSSSSVNLPSLDAVIQECTNGLWSLYFNRNSPYEEEYTFSMSVVSLSTNDFPPVAILNPLDGAIGVSTDPSYMWTGPANFDGLFVLVRDDEAGSNAGSASLSATETTWDGPLLAAGTNTFSASYTSNNFKGLAITEPTGGYPLSNWDASVKITTTTYSTFVTTSGFVPLPVTILPPMVVGDELGFGFISQSGATHTVECTTNLVTGPWQPVTNFPGDGLTALFIRPTTNEATFYRVETQ